MRPYIERKFGQRRPEAEDLASICVIHVLDRLDKFELYGRGSFVGWLYRVVENKVLNELDRRRRKEGGRLVPLDESDDAVREFIYTHLNEFEDKILEELSREGAGANKEPTPESKERRRRFFKLSKLDRRIILLRDLEKQSYETIARDELEKEGQPVTEKALKSKSAAIRKRYERAAERARRLKEGSS
jgi:RNA polymerase sigma factor (sigma-70 family)